MENKMNIRNHIRHTITEGLSAKFSQQAEKAGIIFYDKNEFIPFDDLNYNSEYGYYRMSQFPNLQRDCTNENPETIHYGKDFSEDWKPIIWADSGGNLTMIGDIWQAADLHQALKALLENGAVDAEEISENDPAWDYMKRIDWAVKEYLDFFPDSPLDDDQIRNSIRAAANAARIHGCSQDDTGNWYFRPAAFRGWLVKTRDEKRGRPRAKKKEGHYDGKVYASDSDDPTKNSGASAINKLLENFTGDVSGMQHDLQGGFKRWLWTRTSRPVSKPGITLDPAQYEITDGYIGSFGRTWDNATAETLADAIALAAKRHSKSEDEIKGLLLDGKNVDYRESSNYYYDHSLGYIRRKRQARAVKLVRCACGHSVEQSQVMSASLGTSCPDCYDRMSN